MNHSIEVNLSGIESTKARYLAIALAALSVVQKSLLKRALKLCSAAAATLTGDHANPTGTDCKAVTRIWNSEQAIATMLLASDLSAADLKSRVFDYASAVGSQRVGSGYLALKAHVKLLALSAAILAGDMRIHWASNKYAAAIILLCEALNIDTIDNRDVYALYTSNRLRIDALTDSLDVELRELLSNVELFKSEATASTQRVTSANAMCVLGACSNNGNDKQIVVDKSSEHYQLLRAALLD